jgi:hypothetical protein
MSVLDDGEGGPRGNNKVFGLSQVDTVGYMDTTDQEGWDQGYP